MIKKLTIIYLALAVQILLTNVSFSKIEIIASVNDTVITSYDLKRESNYLKILNPRLDKIKNDLILRLAKESLIKEIIKKEELLKYIDFNKENNFANEYFKELLVKLGYDNEERLNNDLIKFESYTLEEVKFKTKIEIYWNDLIFNKFYDKIKINEDKLKKKIQNITFDDKEEIFLSEIVLKNEKDNSKLQNLIKELQNSILEIGFNNSANIYSISESSKFGGRIGWIDTINISNEIYEKFDYLQINQISNPIKLNDKIIIFKIDDIRKVERKVNKEEELKKLINIETNKKLENYSMIYFNKIKMNYFVNEK